MDGVTLIDYGLALVPVLLMTGLFVWLDVFKLMSLGEMLLLILLGMAVALAAYPISGRMIDALPLGFSFYSRYVAPWIEELLKAVAIGGLMAFNRIGYKVDAVISGFAIGAGFSVLENIFYLQRFADLPPQVWMVRGVGTALMHGTVCAVTAAVAHELAEKANRRAGGFAFNPLWLVPGYVIASALHMGFNQFPDQPLIAMILAGVGTPLVLLSIFHYGAKEAEGWLSVESAGHRQMLDALRAGGWPAGPIGTRIGEFAARQDARHAADVRTYLAASTELTAIAEEKLLGQAMPPASHIMSLFEARDAARTRMGRACFCTLEPLLPFSRNDQWEVRELREDVRRHGL